MDVPAGSESDRERPAAGAALAVFKARDAASYDAFADDYDRYTRRLAAPLARHIVALARIGPGDRVLDLGTGGGVAAREASRAAGPDGAVLGVDLSEGQVRTAAAGGTPEGGAPLEFAVMDAEQLQLPDASRDAVICLNAVLHFPDPERVLAEVRRVLRPGGRVVVSFAHVRPIRPLPLAVHLLRQASRLALRPVRPLLKAPSDLLALAARHDLPERADMHTHWGAGRPQKQALLELVSGAGFTDVRPSWRGHEERFESAEEFWDAQAAIVTLLRKRLELAGAEATARLRDEYVERARAVLARGGRLLYPFGTYGVSGRRPDGD